MSDSDFDEVQYSQLRRSSVLNADCLELFLTGIYTSLFLYTVHAFCTEKRVRRRRGHNMLMTLVSFLYISSLVNLVVDWNTLNRAFVINGATSDSVLDSLDNAPMFENLVPELFKILSIIIADGILIWRCWIIWGCSWIVITPLLLMTAANSVLCLLDLIVIGSNYTIPLTDQAGNMVTAIYSLTLSTTVLGTALIIFRIFQIGSVANVGRYRKVLEVIVESSALYSISILFVLPYWIIDNQGSLADGYPLKFVQTINAAMIGIAPTLLFVRVLNGSARSDDSWSPSTANTLPSIAIRPVSYMTTDGSVPGRASWKDASLPSMTFSAGSGSYPSEKDCSPVSIEMSPVSIEMRKMSGIV